MADQFEERAKKYRLEEQRRRSTDTPVKLTPEERQALQDEQNRKKAEAAATTKTEMGKAFKKGGFVRSADGCAQRGKTRGKMR